MEKVLRAEREADEAVSACKEKAERILEAAREQARRIMHRTDARISALHARCAWATSDRIDAMLREDVIRSRQEVPLRFEHDCLETAVERLVTELTGGTAADENSSS